MMEYTTLHLCANAPWQHATFWYSRVPLQNNHVSFLLLNNRGWCKRTGPYPSPPPLPASFPNTAANKLTSVLRSCTAKWGCPVVAEAICAPAGGSLLPVLAVPSVAIPRSKEPRAHVSNHVCAYLYCCCQGYRKQLWLRSCYSATTRAVGRSTRRRTTTTVNVVIKLQILFCRKSQFEET